MNDADENLWTLTFRVRPGPSPAEHRIRILLKIALRLGLIAVPLDVQAARAHAAPVLPVGGGKPAP